MGALVVLCALCKIHSSQVENAIHIVFVGVFIMAIVMETMLLLMYNLLVYVYSLAMFFIVHVL